MPKGQGKRSDAQRDQADAWGHSVAFKPPVAETAPASSWWTECQTREEFDAKVAQERHRMAESTIGKFKGVIVP